MLNLYLGSYGFMFGNTDVYLVFSRNVITVGLPCVVIGMALRRYEHRMPSGRMLIAMTATLLISLYAEHLIIKSISPVGIHGDIIAFTVPVAAVMLLIFKSIRVSTGALVTQLGRYHATNIYLYHVMFLDIFVMMFGHVTDAEAAFVIACVLMLSMLINKFKRLKTNCLPVRSVAGRTYK